MTVTSTSTIGPTMTGQGILSDQGLVSGLNTSAIISALLASYEAPIANLQSEQSNINSQVTLWQKIQSDIQNLQSAAGALSTSADWGATSATSSNANVATATTSPDATTGSVSFSVDQLAAGQILVSGGTVASTADQITTAGSLLVSAGGAAIGLSSLVGNALSLGAQVVDVTQASAAASTSAATALGTSTTISSTNDTLDATVNGTSYALAIASGTYDPAQLASAITTAAQAAGAPLAASLNGSGEIQLATTTQGSTASLQITGGTALSSLGLSTMTSAVVGIDAVVSVNGTTTTLNALAAGDTVTLNAPSGSITATIGPTGGLFVGSITADEVSTGNGSLASVVSAINGADAGLTASAVANGSGGYLLELASSSTGVNASIGIAPNAFSSSLGTLSQAQAAQDAEISLGGAGGPVISSATNTVLGLLPGLEVSLASVSSTPVTVSVTANSAAMSSAVSSFVTAANTLLSEISSNSKYDQATATGGPLLGSVTAGQITQDVLSVFSTASGTSSLGNLSAVGITENQGTINFNQQAFVTAFQANPTAVQDLFAQGGSFAPAASAYAGQVSLIYAGNGTAAGSYSIVVDQSATQASDTGTVPYASSTATVASSDTLAVTGGGQTATYDVTAGQSLSQVASGLDQAFAAAGMSLSAQVVSSGGSSYLQIVAGQYGTAGDFSVTESGTDFGLGGSFTGQNIAGTINGVTASGSGQILSAPTTDPSLGGLSLQVAVSGITSATAIGSYTYSPGAAQQLASLAASLTAPSGQVTTEISGLQANSASINPEIAAQQQIVNAESQMLYKIYDQLAVTLKSLQAESSSLASSLNSTSSSGGTSSSSVL